MSFMNSFKKLVGVEDDYDEYYDDQYYYDEQEKPAQEHKTFETKPSYESKSNIVTMNSSTSKPVENKSLNRVKINIHEPINFEDAPKVIDVILKNEVAVLNIEMLEQDVKRRIFDFVSGAIYSLDGKMQKVTKDIFVLVPKGVEIDGKIKDQITKNNGFFQLWWVDLVL